MLSTTDFLSQYENCTDEELYKMYVNINDYSDEAKEALRQTIENRGGLDSIINTLKEKQALQNEIERIKKEVTKLSIPTTDLSLLKTLIHSDILTEEETAQIIEEQYASVKIEEEDKKIKPRTIWGSLIGGGIASVIGGGLWGWQMVAMHRIFYIFLIGLLMLCYGIIKFSTKQSKNNIAVVIATIVSTILALIIGQMIFEIFGSVK